MPSARSTPLWSKIEVIIWVCFLTCLGGPIRVERSVSLRTVAADQPGVPGPAHAVAKRFQPFFGIAVLEHGETTCPTGPRTSRGPVHTDAVIFGL